MGKVDHNFLLALSNKVRADKGKAQKKGLRDVHKHSMETVAAYVAQSSAEFAASVYDCGDLFDRPAGLDKALENRAAATKAEAANGSSTPMSGTSDCTTPTDGDTPMPVGSPRSVIEMVQHLKEPKENKPRYAPAEPAPTTPREEKYERGPVEVGKEPQGYEGRLAKPRKYYRISYGTHEEIEARVRKAVEIVGGW